MLTAIKRIVHLMKKTIHMSILRYLFSSKNFLVTLSGNFHCGQFQTNLPRELTILKSKH